jgi:inorganic pyrophosphatase
MRDDYAFKYLGRSVTIQIDRPLASKHPEHGFVYELNYGHVPDSSAPDGEAIDAYLLGINEPVSEYTGHCIAVIHRTDDDDDKLVVVPASMSTISDEEISRATNFQEKWFHSIIIRLGIK